MYIAIYPHIQRNSKWWDIAIRWSGKIPWEGLSARGRGSLDLLMGASHGEWSRFRQCRATPADIAASTFGNGSLEPRGGIPRSMNSG